MSAISFLIGQVLPYVTVLVFVLGMVYRVMVWSRIPAPLKIPLTPAPRTAIGAALRVAVEMLTFRSLLRADRGLWAGGWLTHFFLLCIIAGHIVGIPTLGKEFMVIGFSAEQSKNASAVLGIVMGLAIIPPVLYLSGRRLWNERVRYVSTFSDYFALLLILAIVVTGDIMRLTPLGPEYGKMPTVMEQARLYLRNLVLFQPTPLPGNGAFIAHFITVNLLILYLPFSKLLHGVGMVFSPTLNQANDARERRHVNPWDRMEVS